MTLTRFVRPALALALGGALVVAAAAPAAAAPRQADRPTSPLSAIWDALSSFWHDLAGRPVGPTDPSGAQRITGADHAHMDPNGLVDPPAGGDGHPDMDPDGAGAETDGHPDMDPDGAGAERDDHSHTDPDG